MNYVGPEYNFKVEYSYINTEGKRIFETDVIVAPMPSDAVRKLRIRYDACSQLRIEDVWKEGVDSWDHVHRDWWED